MFDAFMFQVFGLEGMSPVKPMSLAELPGAFALYGLGFFVLMLLFAALYLHANRRRDALGLSALDAFDARALARHHLVSSGVGLILAAFAWFGPADAVFLAPMAFVLMGPGHWAVGRAAAKGREAVVAVSSLSSVRSESVKSVSSVS
jgi:hypothetical protein